MAEVLERFTFPNKGRPKFRKYDWDAWADGRIRKVNPMRDFGVSPRTFQSAVRCQVMVWRNQGKIVLFNTSHMDGNVVFRILIDGC